ncbi:unnamed protein product [Amoebophrya sp. A120]|nr:unnamed protein product [Amoebophrya sp. A120]|eukprot:GSA120T00002747001.1
MSNFTNSTSKQCFHHPKNSAHAFQRVSRQLRRSRGAAPSTAESHRTRRPHRITSVQWQQNQATYALSGGEFVAHTDFAGRTLEPAPATASTPRRQRHQPATPQVPHTDADATAPVHRLERVFLVDRPSDAEKDHDGVSMTEVLALIKF